MKKNVLTIIVVLASLQFVNAQLSFGIKGGLNIVSPKDLVTSNGDIKTDIDNNTSYHAGLWMRVKIPVIGLYVRPEIIYTSIELSTNTPLLGGFEIRRIDLPVLIGKKFFGLGNVFIGPVFETVLESDFNVTGINELDTDDFFVGLQVGIGIEFWKLGIDARYETSFSDNVSKFESDLESYSLDNSPKQILVGLSYKF